MINVWALHGRTKAHNPFLYIQNLNIHVKTESIFDRCETSLFVINNYIIHICIYLYAVLSGNDTLQSVRDGWLLCKEQDVFIVCHVRYRFCKNVPQHTTVCTSSTAACPGDSVWPIKTFTCFVWYKEKLSLRVVTVVRRFSIVTEVWCGRVTCS